MVGGGPGDGARRGQVTIVEFIDPRPYIFPACRVRQADLHGNLYERPSIHSGKSRSPFHLPPELRSLTTQRIS